ncbi:hypothetical protein AJ80_05264 [Polytolypa hystricis UAMH7299]|uniref:Uncharacterized protein n=1 Tax=Polytolypa hystricis (strain UAMH7299) TaxID=1447883 RepID=A0A2B7Y5F8_POLH7|nr:hypothetical protein AJ80_05264 [Polytolypa hystricis UAMH7299]
MAKTRPSKKSSKKKNKPANGSSSTSRRKMNEDPAVLFEQATALLLTGQPESALSIAEKGLEIAPTGSSNVLIGLNLVAEIYVELGDIDTARQHFTRAVALDPNGEIPESQGGGAEKFLWLAQLSEDGGMESVRWYERGVAILRSNIQSQEQSGGKGADASSSLEDEKKKLSHALCAVVEIYMTDLSWEEDAESKCEALVTEALLISPESPECLQTLASIRISQLRHDDARAALSRSLDLWKDLPPESPEIPDFPTRVSLSRLLMEAQMEAEALDVLGRMILDDDESIETLYLGGWCHYLLGNKIPKDSAKEAEVELRQSTLRSSRSWLKRSLKLYDLVQYEDEKLKEHALELVQEIEQELGDVGDDSEGEPEDDEWEDEVGSDDDEDSTKDQEMADS